jgi:hypothetical protein
VAAKVGVSVGVPVLVLVGVAVALGVTVGMLVGQTGAITMIVPFIAGCMLQRNGKVPTVSNTRVNVFPGRMLPLFHTPCVLVEVCVVPPVVFVQRTLEPWVMVVV